MFPPDLHSVYVLKHEVQLSILKTCIVTNVNDQKVTVAFKRIPRKLQARANMMLWRSAIQCS